MNEKNLLYKELSLLDEFFLTLSSKEDLHYYIRYRQSMEWHSNKVPQNYFVCTDEETGIRFCDQLDDLLKDTCSEQKILTLGIREEALLAQKIRLSDYCSNDILVITGVPDRELTEGEAEAWHTLSELMMKRNMPTFLLLAPAEVIDKRFRPYPQIYYRTFHNRLHFKSSLSEEDVFYFCLKHLEEEDQFSCTDVFKDELKLYIDRIYPTADLQDKIFVEDLCNRIYRCYIRKEDANHVLDESCIPYYNRARFEMEDETKTEARSSVNVPSPEEQTEQIPAYVESELSPGDILGNTLILSLSTFPGKGPSRSLRRCNLFDAIVGNDSVGFGDGYYYQLEPVPYKLIDKLADEGKSLDTILMICTEDVKKYTGLCEIRDGIEYRIFSHAEDKTTSPLDYFYWKVTEYDKARRNLQESSIQFKTFTLSAAKDKDKLSDIAVIVDNILGLIRSHTSDSGGSIYVDSHGGLRTTQAIINSLFSLLPLDGHVLDTDNILTVDFDGQNGTISPAGEAVDVLNFVTGLTECTNYGRIDSLDKYYEKKPPRYEIEEKILDSMRKIANAISLCNMVSFGQNVQELSNLLDTLSQGQYSDSLLYTFSHLIRNNYEELLNPEHSVLNEISWCVKKGFIQQALTLVESKMPAEIIRKGLITESKITKAAIEKLTQSEYQFFERDKKSGDVRITHKMKFLIKQNNAKSTSWKDCNNYVVDTFAKTCVKFTKKTDMDGFEISIGHYIPISVFSHRTSIAQNKIRNQNIKTLYSRPNSEAYNIIKTLSEAGTKEVQKNTNIFFQMHMALKNERNSANHAGDSSEESVRNEVALVQDAINEYVKLAKELGLPMI